MKYEMIFGDEGLFDGAPEDVDMIGYSGGFYKNSPDGPVYCCGCTFTTDEYRNKGFIAMRRIIKGSKRWTVEDQKAGVLPEVGCEVILRTSGELTTVNAAHKNRVCLTFSDGSFSPFNIERIDPIETPAEKAQREEDEFVTSLCKELDGTSLQHNSIYERGVRAAYRKLKGGE
jgi:hypothetical protein